MNLNINVFNVLIFLGIVHGIIFSLILLINSNIRSKTNNYLSFTILVLSFSNLQYIMYDVGIIGDFYVQNIFIPFEYLILPMFYLFVRSYLEKSFTKKLILTLLSPFILIFSIQLFSALFKINSLRNILNIFSEHTAIVFTFALIILIFHSIIRYEKSISKNSFSETAKTTSWLKRLLIIGIVLCIIWFLSLNIFKDYLGEKLYPFYPLWIGTSILIYWIAYTSIFQTNIWNERKDIKKLKSNIKQSKIPQNKSQQNKFDEINLIIINDELYLNPLLSLSMLSKKIGISEGYLSKLINTNSGKNYNDYINEFRVEYAKKLLVNKEFSNYTITSIGLESGFNTKTSFYSTFKKITLQTPNQYKKSVQNH